MTDTSDIMKRVEAEIIASNAEPDPSISVAAPLPDKYTNLRNDIIKDAEKMAQNYEMIAQRYTDMAVKIREHGAAAAKQHIEDLVALDKAEEAISRHYAKAKTDGRIDRRD